MNSRYARARSRASLVEHQTGGAGRALVDREDHRRRTYPARDGRARQVHAHEVGELAAAVQEARRASAPVARCSRSSSTSSSARPARAASIVIAGLHPEAVRRTAAGARASAPRIARWPEIGARSSSPVSERIAQRANPTAIPKPPPARRANAATARSQRPASTASDQRPEPRRRARRGRRRRARTCARPAPSARQRAARRGRRRAALAPASPAASARAPRPRAPRLRGRGVARSRRPRRTRARPGSAAQHGRAPSRRSGRPRRGGDDHDASACSAAFGGTAGYSAADLPAPKRTGGSTWPTIEAHITGTVWKIEVSPGDKVDEGDTVVILESMKMEMPVEAEDAGTVKEISVEEGQAVSEGDTLVVLRIVAGALGLRQVVLDRPAEAVARLTIRNPSKRNALDHEILDAIATAMDDLDDGIETRCVIITGSRGDVLRRLRHRRHPRRGVRRGGGAAGRAPVQPRDRGGRARSRSPRWRRSTAMRSAAGSSWP